MRQIYNMKMVEGTSAREHCLKMISNLNTFEVLGADIDGESQVDMILQSPPESFKKFRLNYNMNKKIYSLSELMNDLVAAEGILNGDIKYSLKISLMSFVIQSIRPNHFSKELLKYIFMKSNFINI